MGQTDFICSKTNKKIYSVETEIVYFVRSISFLNKRVIKNRK